RLRRDLRRTAGGLRSAPRGHRRGRPDPLRPRRRDRGRMGALPANSRRRPPRARLPLGHVGPRARRPDVLRRPPPDRNRCMIAPEVFTFPDPQRLARAAAETVVETLRAAIGQRGRADLVLTGGSTPRAL